MRSAVRAWVIAVAVAISSMAMTGCGASTANQNSASCPIMTGVNLAEVHMSASSFTIAYKGIGRRPVTDLTGHVSGCQAPYGNGVLDVSFSTHLTGRFKAITEQAFQRDKSTRQPLHWSGINAFIWQSHLAYPKELNIRFWAHNHDGDILCVCDPLMPIKDFETMAQALLRAAASS